MESRIEILKDGVWVKLRLQNSDSIRYNAVINKIGNPTNRQIGSTNTFALPKTHDNIQALGINVFNQYDLAKALNRKYQAKYYIEEKIVQEGFLLINNTLNGLINVNFIDKSLDVISKWGTITYHELLNNTSFPINDDYEAAIEELSDYQMDPNSILSPLSEVGTRGYNLCLFPSNLNAIGDAFQKDENGNRTDDSFNPYQSRPLYNAMSLFDLACERFGYTGIFDDSVDWNTIKTTYMISPDNDKNEEGSENGYETIEYEPITQTDWQSRYPFPFLSLGTAVMVFTEAQSIQPSDIPNWVDSEGIYSPGGGIWKPASFWQDSNTVFTPNLSSGNAGDISFRANTIYSGTDLPDYPIVHVITYWYPMTASEDVISVWYTSKTDGIPSGALTFPNSINKGSEYDLDITIDKDLFNSIPAGADRLIGVSIQFIMGSDDNDAVVSLENMIVTETSLTAGSVTFDTYGQYEANEIDLRHGASRKSLKTLLSSMMHKEGILMNIYNETKEIKFFSYGHYEAQQEAGNFMDWTKYHLKYSEPEWKTNYGNDYGKINEISLSEPFQGNTYTYELENQGEESRYKDLGLDTNKNFKDVSNVLDVANTNNPWTEFTNKGLGLIEYRNNAGILDQYRMSNDSYNSQGSFSGLPYIYNVNYGSIPTGVKEWYQLIDQAVRCKAKFLLPIEVIKTLDLSKPVYVGELGGFYIIEKVSQYVGPTEPVTVNLIKLISELTANPNPPRITLRTNVVIYGLIPTQTYSVENWFKCYNTTPESVVINGVQYDDDPDNGGTPTGLTITHNVNLPPYSQTVIDGPIPGTDPKIGWWSFTATANNGLTTDPNIIYFGNSAGSDPYTYMFYNEFGTGEGYANVQYEYFNYSQEPTYSTFTYQLWDQVNDVALGPVQNKSFPTNPETGVVLVNFGQPGFYHVSLETNVATTATPLGGGWYIT